MAEEIDSASTYGKLIVQRRHALGLTSEAVDHAAGLTLRHTQKIEDATRRLGSRTFTPENFMHKLLIGGLSSPDVQIALHAMVSGQVETRIPRLDTALLALHALGGRVVIEWGDPPAITKSMMK